MSDPAHYRGSRLLVVYGSEAPVRIPSQACHCIGLFEYAGYGEPIPSPLLNFDTQRRVMRRAEGF